MRACEALERIAAWGLGGHGCQGVQLRATNGLGVQERGPSVDERGDFGDRLFGLWHHGKRWPNMPHAFSNHEAAL